MQKALTNCKFHISRYVINLIIKIPNQKTIAKVIQQILKELETITFNEMSYLKLSLNGQEGDNSEIEALYCYL